MELRKFTILPAAIALSLMTAPVAFAGADKGPDTGGEHGGGGNDGKDGKDGKDGRDGQDGQDGKDGRDGQDGKDGRDGRDGKDGRDGRDGRDSQSGSIGGGDQLTHNLRCKIGNRTFYADTRQECLELKYARGYGGGSVSVGGRVNVGGYVRQTRRTRVVVDGGYVNGGYGYYQPQRVIRYVAQPSPAARKQMERRARKAARLAAEQAAAYGYAYGGGYGNGVVVGGYGNNVMINGNVYGGGAYAQGGYGYGEQVVVRKKRKGKKARRVIIQQPAYVYGDGYAYGGGYGYEGPVMVKGGGY